MSHRFCLCLLASGILLLAASPLWAQTVQVQGVVRDADTRITLPDVNVTLEREGAVIAGTATDADGRYEIGGVPAGSYVVYARYIGYQTAQADVVIGEDLLSLDLRLEAAVLDLEGVEVVAAPVQERSDPTVSLTRIRPQQVRELAGGAEDVLRTLQALPGVVAASDFSNQLIVRGGTPDQNLIILDEIEVYSPYQLSGMGSLLNPSLVRQVDLFAGAFPAVYGDRLSSVLSVQTRDGTPEKWLGGEISTNLVLANLILEGRTGFWQGSWLVSGRRTYFDSFANTFAKRVGVFNDIAFPDFEDVQFKLSLRPARGHQLRFTGVRSTDLLDLVGQRDIIGEQEGANESLREGGNTSENIGLGLTWDYVPSANTQVKLFTNWYRNNGENGLSGSLTPQDGGFDFNLTDQLLSPPPPVFGGDDVATFAYDQMYRLQKASVAGRFSHSMGRHTFEAGGGVDYLENELDLDLELNSFGTLVFNALRVADPLLGVLADSISQTKRYNRYQFYVQDKIASSKGEVFIQPSLRYDYYSLIGKSFLSPRLSVSILLDDATTVRFAGGRYLQSPGFEKLLDPDNPFSLGRFTTLDSLNVERAVHLGTSLSRRLGDRWNVKVDGYWKQLDDLIINRTQRFQRLVASFERQLDVNNRPVGALDPQGYVVAEQEVFELTTDPENRGSGKAYGVDLLIEKRALEASDNWQGWLSYSYARANRDQVVGEAVIRFPFEYDRRHAVNLTLNRRLGRYFSAALTWRYGSGFPYTPAASMEPLVGLVDDPVTGEMRSIVLIDPETNLIRLVPGFGNAENINSERLPDYHRLDTRFTFATQWRGRAFELYLDLINLYNRRNVMSYQYYVEVKLSPKGLPEALTPPDEAFLFREPVYMFPFIPSFGFNLSF